MAKDIIAQRHPLNVIPLYEVFVVLKPFKIFFPSYQKQRGVFSDASNMSGGGDIEEEKQPLVDAVEKKSSSLHKFLKKAQQTQALAQEDGGDGGEKKDPFTALGFGICAYFELIQTFFWLFIIITLLMIPCIQFFMNHKGYKSPIGYEIYSLGNMGFSSAQCVNVPMDVSSTPLHCPYGTIGHIKDFGITPQGADISDNCVNNNNTIACSPFLNKQSLAAIDSCIGKPSCTINATQEFIFGDRYDEAPADCKSDDAILFA